MGPEGEAPATGRWARLYRKVRGTISQLGLFAFFTLYTIGGAKVFQALEHPAEIAAHQTAGKALTDSRQQFLDRLLNATVWPHSVYRVRASEALRAYEVALEEAVGAGVSPLEPSVPSYRWHFVESVFFASTVITTIGYGNVAPVTAWGRLFCILYAFVGIPVTLTVIADLGTIFANALSGLYERARRLAVGRGGMLKCVSCPAGVLGLAGGRGLGRGSRGLLVLGTVGALLLYLAAGAAFFLLWESEWTFLDAFYFCFITMTTIGLGDLVPARTDVMLVCTLYILVGLALTSTIIELVRRQYAESWKQMKELSGRLGELSGPLAEHLRRLGDQAGDLNIDVHLLKDLRELRNAIQLSNKLEVLSSLDPKLRGDSRIIDLLKTHLNGGDENSPPGTPGDTEHPKSPLLLPRDSTNARGQRRVIQVVIYETSV